MPDIDFNENYPLPKLDGATAMYPYYAAVYQDLYDSSLEQDIYLNCSSSQYAFDKLNEGKADILFLAGISDDQRKDYDFDFTVTPLCKDAFVFIVPFGNPVSSLSYNDLQKIYGSENSENWETYGGKDMEIELYKLVGENMGSNIALNEFLAVNENYDLYINTNGMVPMLFDVYRNGRGSMGL
jgi:phosphate transport system substrate-binding protein